MKLKNKVIIGAGGLWGGFMIAMLVIALIFQFSFFSISIFAFLSTVFLITLLFLFHFIVTDQLETLALSVSEINDLHRYSDRLVVKGNDEITELCEEINTVLELAQSSEDKVDLRVQARTLKLDKRVDDLKKNVLNLESLKDKLLYHNQHLEKVLHYDALTALPNRICFSEILNKKISNARKNNKTLALLAVNLDNFKAVNDTLGKATGDVILKESASRFKSMMRSSDTLARTAGSEFCILLDDIVHDEFSAIVAEKVLEIGSQPYRINNKIVNMIISIGISIFPKNGTTLEKLIKTADTALFKAKADGGERFYFYNKEMHIEITKLNKLGVALKNAIKLNEFVLYYQPKLDLKSGHVSGVEALLRWESPVLGLISPSRFIPLAEETNTINDIGEWVLKEACRVNKSWQLQGFPPLPIGVNLSSYQFKHQDIAALISSVLKETSLPPDSLELEINAAIVMDDIEVATKILHAIKNTGVKIILDKFGSGSISISSLRDLPIDGLKIDSKFIKGVPENTKNLQILNALIHLANDLKLSVTATGIESAEQLHYLVSSECNLGQGYFFSKPVPEYSFMSSYFYRTQA